MSEMNDQYSDTSSDLNWPLDHPMERQQHDQVVFENVADQYVKGDDVTAFFTIFNDIKVNPEEDQIGLLRVGCTNIKECLAYAPVQYNPSTSSGTTRHGTATFPSSSLPVTDDEFYQFCYIINKTKKNLGSSIPFQLNCSLDDIDLLSNSPVGKTKSDSLIALADLDNDDIVIIHTKRMLIEEKLRQENRQLLEMNRRLELQKDECQAKFDLLESKTNEHITKACNDMQTLSASHKAAIDELSSRQQIESKLRTEYDACRSLCSQYQAECLQQAERCRALEDVHKQIITEANVLRSQLSVTSQLTKDQATQIIDLERRLIQSNELSKTTNQRQTLLEQQIRDLRLTSEKHEMSMEAQIDSFNKKTTEQENHLIELETKNNLLKEEIKSLNEDNECLSIMAKQDKQLSEELQQQIDELREQYHTENELAKNEIERLKTQLEEMNSNEQAYMVLKASYTEIEKRCVKHQKTEIEVKRQLSVYKGFVNDLQSEIQDLTQRLSDGADEYKTLFRKYTALERKTNSNHHQEQTDTVDTTTATTTTLSNETGLNEEALVSLLRNSYELQQQDQENKQEDLINEITTTPTSFVDAEIRECPMCYWEFPQDMMLSTKTEHIEHHFQ